MAPERVRDTAGTPPAAAGAACTARGRPGTGPTNAARTPAGVRGQTPAAHTAQPPPSQRPALPFHKMAATPPPPPDPSPTWRTDPHWLLAEAGSAFPTPPRGRGLHHPETPARALPPLSQPLRNLGAVSRERGAGRAAAVGGGAGRGRGAGLRCSALRRSRRRCSRSACPAPLAWGPHGGRGGGGRARGGGGAGS